MSDEPSEFETVINRGLGTWAPSLGTASGQHRFLFRPKDDLSQVEIFDRVAGLLHREVGKRFFIRALYLYPPDAVDESALAQSAMVLLGHDDSLEPHLDADEVERALSQEYERLGRIVVADLADLSEPHHPGV